MSNFSCYRDIKSWTKHLVMMKNVHMIYLVISVTNMIKNIFYKGQLLFCFYTGVCVAVQNVWFQCDLSPSSLTLAVSTAGTLCSFLTRVWCSPMLSNSGFPHHTEDQCCCKQWWELSVLWPWSDLKLLVCIGLELGLGVPFSSEFSVNPALQKKINKFSCHNVFTKIHFLQRMNLYFGNPLISV